MFTIKAFINEQEIGSIDIQNAGLMPITTHCEYKLRRVNGVDYGPHSSILHKRKKGWKVLAVKVLQHLIEDDDELAREEQERALLAKRSGAAPE